MVPIARTHHPARRSAPSKSDRASAGAAPAYTLRAVVHGFGLALVLVQPATRASALQRGESSPIVLTHPDRVTEQKFSLVQSARELADGRLLISDFIEERIAIIDFTNDVVSDRTRNGPGPDEFRLPGALRAFRGDSTLLVDMGNSRIDVLDGDGRIRRVLVPPSPGAAYPAGADSQGRLYFGIPAWTQRQPLPGDTVELATWDPVTGHVESLARIHGSTRAPPPTGPQDGPRLPMVVFAPQDAWAVGAGGRIAIVSGADFSVRWLAGGRVVATGPPAATPQPRVTAADRTAWVREFAVSSPVSGKGPGGTLGQAPAESSSPAEIERMVRRTTFADVLPFFRAGDARIDAAGRLWVGLMTPTGQPRRYDVFDGSAKRIATVELGPGRRLLAVGVRHVYTVVSDDVGLETVERHSMPVIRGE
jgi:hypothetical protein